MSRFDSVPEPWASLWGAGATTAVGVFSSFCGWYVFEAEVALAFGAGMTLGAVICIILRWAARIDERPFWQHVVGREAVYPELQDDEPESAEPGNDASPQ